MNIQIGPYAYSTLENILYKNFEQPPISNPIDKPRFDRCVNWYRLVNRDICELAKYPYYPPTFATMGNYNVWVMQHAVGVIYYRIGKDNEGKSYVFIYDFEFNVARYRLQENKNKPYSIYSKESKLRSIIKECIYEVMRDRKMIV